MSVVHTGVRGIRDSLPQGVLVGRMSGGNGPAQLITFAGVGAAIAGTPSGASPAFADMETPGGAINGSNLVYTLLHSPAPAISLLLFKNGVLQRPGGVDYTLAGSTITYVAGAVLQTGDTHVCSYRF